MVPKVERPDASLVRSLLEVRLELSSTHELIQHKRSSRPTD